MKAVSEILAGRGKTGAAGRNQPASSASAAGEKPSHDRRADGLRTVSTTRGFLLVQIAMFVVLATIHFGLLIGGYDHRAAGATELIIAAVLLAAVLLTWMPAPWSRRPATAAQSFGILGVLGAFLTIAIGIGPRTMLDLFLNVGMLLTLTGGLAITFRKP